MRFGLGFALFGHRGDELLRIEDLSRPGNARLPRGRGRRRRLHAELLLLLRVELDAEQRRFTLRVRVWRFGSAPAAGAEQCDERNGSDSMET